LMTMRRNEASAGVLGSEVLGMGPAGHGKLPAM
jgi:hypothetical protein